MSENIELRRKIAEEMLGPIDERGNVKCPGEALHSSKTARNHCRIYLTGVPTLSCQHGTCKAVIDEVNTKLRSEIGKAEFKKDENYRPPATATLPKPAPEPKEDKPSDEVNMQAVNNLAARIPREISFNDLKSVSPLPIPKDKDIHLGLWMINQLYDEGEKVLVFSNFYSQGDFLIHVGHGTYRLGAKPNIKAVSSPLPFEAPQGVWFLTAPVTGKWEEKADGEYSRRHVGAVEAFRFIVLESDTIATATWLKILIQLELPISAIYTSGGRSVHTLIRIPDSSSKEGFDLYANILKTALVPFGVDGKAISAVRLSRLPGCYRLGAEKNGKFEHYEKPRLQQLLYVNPNPKFTPISSLLNF